MAILSLRRGPPDEVKMCVFVCVTLRTNSSLFRVPWSLKLNRVLKLSPSNVTTKCRHVLATFLFQKIMKCLSVCRAWYKALSNGSDTIPLRDLYIELEAKS